MSDNKEKPKEEPIKPATPSSPPGTPLRKAPDKFPIKPAEPSERPGTAIPFEEPKKEDRIELDE